MHIDTLPPSDARNITAGGLVHLSIDYIDLTVPLDCYFDPYDGSLWHAYLGTTELFNVLAKAVITDFEDQFLLAELT